MRSTIDAELAFKSQLIDNTKKLVSDQSLSLAQKLAAIQQAVRENGSRIRLLKKARRKASQPAAIRRIEGLIALRERGTGYLVAMAKWLVATRRHPLSLRQQPCGFAVPTWQWQPGR